MSALKSTVPSSSLESDEILETTPPRGNGWEEPSEPTVPGSKVEPAAGGGGWGAEPDDAPLGEWGDPDDQKNETAVSPCHNRTDQDKLKAIRQDKSGLSPESCCWDFADEAYGRLEVRTLHDAAQYNDVERMQDILEEIKEECGWDPSKSPEDEQPDFNEEAFEEETYRALNELDTTGMAPLHLAARFGCLKAVRYLLEQDAWPDNANRPLQHTPLHIASWQGHPEITNLLLEWDADHSLKSRSGFTALHGAAYRRRPVSMRVLIQGGASLDENALIQGEGLLHVIAKKGNVECARVAYETRCEWRLEEQANAVKAGSGIPVDVLCKLIVDFARPIPNALQQNADKKLAVELADARGNRPFLVTYLRKKMSHVPRPEEEDEEELDNPWKSGPRVDSSDEEGGESEDEAVPGAEGLDAGDVVPVPWALP